MKEHSTDVLIVGAGPTGLLLACELVRQGIDFRIIDRSSKPSQLSRATGLHWLSLEILEDLGLGRRVREEGTWLPATSVYQNGKLLKRIPLNTKPPGDASEPSPSLLILEQYRAEELLTEHLAEQGVEIERKCELKDFKSDDSGVVATVSRKRMLETWNCRYIVGCDGPKSQIRESLGIAFPGLTYACPYLLAEVRMDWELPAEMFRFLGEKADLMAVPLGGDLFRLTAWEKSGEEPSAGAAAGEQHASPGMAPTVEQIQSLVDQVVPVPAKVLEARTLLRYRIESRLALNYGKGRAFIAGDACHVHPPTGSQGLNTGFQDAYNLGWKMAAVLQGESPEKLLESYEQERRPVGNWVLNNTHQAAMTRFDMLGNRFELDGDELVVPAWNQSTVNYRGSSAVMQMQSVGGELELQAGDRAPDGLLGKAGSSDETRLYDVLKGGKHQLLVFGGEGDEAFLELVTSVREQYDHCIDIHLVGVQGEGWGQESWVDPDGALAGAYSVGEPTAVLIRPDRYVGVKAGTHMVAPFLEFLGSYFSA